MRAAIVAALLITASCRGDRKPPPPATAVPSIVPKLPRSPDGVAELHAIDQRIELHKANPHDELAYLGQRAAARGRLEDYQAMLAISADWVAKSPNDSDAWLARAHALAAVHQFADARAALAHASGEGVDDESTALDEATGKRDRSLAARASLAKIRPNAVTITLYVASLALAGKFAEARALIPKAAVLAANNPPDLFAWMYFQWGRVYEQQGDLASARAFYEASHARMPSIEATAHLIAAQLATGQPDAAKRLVAETLKTDPHPSILELAVAVGLAPVADAKAAWDRYVAALPTAFADHAARFYLKVDPKHALELARQNLANRDTPEARSLVVEAALAADDPAAACAVVDPLVAAPQRGDRFMAWRALSRCGRGSDAERLAKDLGIGP
ncbi:MAG TPA: tetratricopeptide repeat protein [Kofleriaceae bacterium]|jgi:tetratricopeptide (TPR) repeat protein